jgi:DNA-directed RNA polymerase specialized sigma24 family protein
MFQTVFSADPERQRLIQLWLESHTQSEIAAELGCSERTVRRMQEKVRNELTEYLRVTEGDAREGEATEST